MVRNAEKMNKKKVQGKVPRDQISCPLSPRTRVPGDRGHENHAPCRLGPGSQATGGMKIVPPVASDPGLRRLGA
jgi:hypothetical protein